MSGRASALLVALVAVFAGCKGLDRQDKIYVNTDQVELAQDADAGVDADALDQVDLTLEPDAADEPDPEPEATPEPDPEAEPEPDAVAIGA